MDCFHLILSQTLLSNNIFFPDLNKSHTDLSNQIVSYQNQIETIKKELEAAQADLAAKNLSCETGNLLKSIDKETVRKRAHRVY